MQNTAQKINFNGDVYTYYPVFDHTGMCIKILSKDMPETVQETLILMINFETFIEQGGSLC